MNIVSLFGKGRKSKVTIALHVDFISKVLGLVPHMSTRFMY
ncbi:hypothetical protein [Candidatus Sulfurimonas baltica]|nr:hypothetical protein [Candidatus Sulfurimonas baltica]